MVFQPPKCVILAEHVSSGIGPRPLTQPNHPPTLGTSAPPAGAPCNFRCYHSVIPAEPLALFDLRLIIVPTYHCLCLRSTARSPVYPVPCPAWRLPFSTYLHRHDGRGTYVCPRARRPGFCVPTFRRVGCHRRPRGLESSPLPNTVRRGQACPPRQGMLWSLYLTTAFAVFLMPDTDI